MSEKSTRKAPDYAVESRAAPNRSLFSTANAVLVLKTHQERYNSSESGLKKEIPTYITDIHTIQKTRPVQPGPPPALLLRLRGSLGNQFFEYAAGRALAMRNHVPLWLDTTSGFCGDRYGRSYALGAFNVADENTEQVPSADFGISAELFRRFVGRRGLLRARILGRYFAPAIYRCGIAESPFFVRKCCDGLAIPLRAELFKRIGADKGDS